MARPQQVSNEELTAALGAHPEATAADLAGVLGIGQSTAAKRLTALEAAGSVRRTPGGRVAGVRVPDHWSVVPARTALGFPAADNATLESPQSARAVPGDAVTDDAAPDDAAPAEATPEEATPVPSASDADGARGAATGGAVRLGRGELGALVREFLAARPGESFGPAAVGKALGRSQGAVSNALSTMAARGEVTLVEDKPRRYRIAG